MTPDVTRRNFIKTGVAAAAWSMAPRLHANGGGSLPNVVYVFSDTHRWCSMNFTETAQVSTPTMQAMAANGVSFRNCYSTLPLCSPHRAMLMTGHWPWQQGFIANHMSLADRVDGGGTAGTLGWMFKNAGYRTYYTGKWHLGGNTAVPYGFDWSCIWNSEDHTEVKFTGAGTGNPCGTGSINWVNDPRYTGVPAHPPRPAYPTFPYLIIGETDTALLYLDRHRANHPTTPFFLMLSWQDPHPGWRTDGVENYPPHLQDRYDPGTIPQRGNDTINDETNRMDYHASVNAVDDELARVRQYLTDHGLADNTILIYTSDHGGMLGTQGVGGGQKRWPHDESTLVPFLVEWPDGIPLAERGSICEALFSSVDIFPTVCNLAGVPAQLALNGATASLNYLNACPGLDHSANILAPGSGPDPDSVFVCHPSNMNNGSGACPVTRTVITKDFMYSVEGKTRLGTNTNWTGWRANDEREQWMYDRHSDPLQLTNLIANPAYEGDRNALRMELARWLDKAEFPFVANWFDTMNPSEVAAWVSEHDGVERQDAFSLWDFAPAPPESFEVSATVKRGTQTDMLTVELTCDRVGENPVHTHPVTLHVTTDGTDPNVNSPTYSAPLEVPAGSRTVNVLAVDHDRGRQSHVVRLNLDAVGVS